MVKFCTPPITESSRSTSFSKSSILVRITFVSAWEWVVLQRLSDIEIRQIAVFTDFIPLQFRRFFTDLFPLNVNLVNFSISNASVLFLI